jgi:putative Mn2+ efflux pump MntP
MDWLEILLIAGGLSMDAFAVALGAAASGRTLDGRATFRLSFHFGLFQFLMPVLGWSAGVSVSALVASVDHWLAFALLLAVGVRMIRAGLRKDAPTYRRDPTRGWSLVALSVATSLDAFGVGLSLAMLAGPIWYPAVVIGVVTGALTLVGVRLGSRLGARVGGRMEIAGGVILIAVGVRIVFAHLGA